jgi:diacylglycerol kinase (ATP)
MADPRRLLVIHNPAAGRRRGALAAAVVAALRTEGAEVVVRETAARGDAERFARAAGPDVNVVVAAGGDGTINEVINGLSSRSYAIAPPALGVIPLGTVNVLARELALPSDVPGIARLLAHGRTVPLHSGIANGRRFALMAGVGFDARVVRRVDPGLKRAIGRGAYALAVLRELIVHTTARYRVTIDEREAIEAASVIVAKSRLYGGPFELAAGASVRKPVLHVCLFRDGGRWNAVRYLAAVGLGRIARTDGFQIISASRITITGPPGEPVQGDGDTLGTLPLDILLAEQALSVIAPPP